jgi:hypothetical protein
MSKENADRPAVGIDSKMRAIRARLDDGDSLDDAANHRDLEWVLVQYNDLRAAVATALSNLNDSDMIYLDTEARLNAHLNAD